jgi:hypothetical protein
MYRQLLQANDVLASCDNLSSDKSGDARQRSWLPRECHGSNNSGGAEGLFYELKEYGSD